jgi:peroxiredoxin
MAEFVRSRLRIGAPAPPLELPTAAGRRQSLLDLRGRPVLVSFLGPAHCPFCRAHVIRMVQARDQVASIGAEVVLVAYHDPDLLTAKMLHDLDLPYVLLLDPARAAYRSWGLEQARFRNWLSLGFFREALKMTLRREPSMGSSPGPVQLGGDFVVDRRGYLLLVNHMRSFHDRAGIPEVLSVLARA